MWPDDYNPATNLGEEHPQHQRRQWHRGGEISMSRQEGWGSPQPPDCALSLQSSAQPSPPQEAPAEAKLNPDASSRASNFMRPTTSRWHRTESCESGLQIYQEPKRIWASSDDALKCVDGIVTRIGDDKILLGERVDGTADGAFNQRSPLLAGQDGGQTNSLDFTSLFMQGPSKKVQGEDLTNIRRTSQWHTNQVHGNGTPAPVELAERARCSESGRVSLRRNCNSCVVSTAAPLSFRPSRLTCQLTGGLPRKTPV